MKSTDRKEAIRKAFEAIDIKALAKELKTTPGAMYNVKYGQRRVSAWRAIEIERASGKLGNKIGRALLRPDIFEA